MTPSGRLLPKLQTWRIVKTSAATCIAVAQASKSPMRDVVMMALAPSRAERGGSVDASPQQRQRRRDHAGAQDAENCQYALDCVGKLNADDGVGLQAELTQSGRDRGDGAVGFGIGQTARRAVGEALAVGRIGECDGVRPPRGGAAEHVVERR